MDKKDLEKFLVELKKTVFEAGEVAIREQKNVINIGKKVENLDNDSDYVMLQRTAKTVIDDQVQEMILSMVINTLNPKEIYLDAEEDTPSVKYFSDVPTNLSLIIDPIDGTLQYVSGREIFSICVALIEKGDILASLVYFPVKKEYYLQKGNKVFYEKNGFVQEMSVPRKINKKSVYLNNRVDLKFLDNLKENNFEIINDEESKVTWPEGLIKCLKGEIGVCIFHSPQIRDILLGVMISKIIGGYACDWNGEKIEWPYKGRVPRIIFGFGDVSLEILSCLS